jgi:hypothetical protein
MLSMLMNSRKTRPVFLAYLLEAALSKAAPLLQGEVRRRKYLHSHKGFGDQLLAWSARELRSDQWQPCASNRRTCLRETLSAWYMHYSYSSDTTALALAMHLTALLSILSCKFDIAAPLC